MVSVGIRAVSDQCMQLEAKYVSHTQRPKCKVTRLLGPTFSSEPVARSEKGFAFLRLRLGRCALCCVLYSAQNR
jgi:hypothetical protein